MCGLSLTASTVASLAPLFVLPLSSNDSHCHLPALLDTLQTLLGNSEMKSSHLEWVNSVLAAAGHPPISLLTTGTLPASRFSLIDAALSRSVQWRCAGGPDIASDRTKGHAQRRRLSWSEGRVTGGHATNVRPRRRASGQPEQEPAHPERARECDRPSGRSR